MKGARTSGPLSRRHQRAGRPRSRHDRVLHRRPPQRGGAEAQSGILGDRGAAVAAAAAATGDRAQATTTWADSQGEFGEVPTRANCGVARGNEGASKRLQQTGHSDLLRENAPAVEQAHFPPGRTASARSLIASARCPLKGTVRLSACLPVSHAALLSSGFCDRARSLTEL